MHTRQIDTVIAAVAAILVVAVTTMARETTTAVAFPTGYRSWQHVRTIVVGPDHPLFARRGGFHHYYANAKAVEGYRTGTFPNGSVIVDEGVLTKDGDGQSKGIVFEAERRSLDVMVKDDTAYKDTAGWGYEHFIGTAEAPTLTAERRKACSECHANQAEKDSVFSRIRP